MRVNDTSREESERGAVAIVVALMMVTLMGLAALAVDSGLAFGERRQHQSAADFGALAAVQFARTASAASHPDCAALVGASFAACRGAEEVLEVVDGTLPGLYTDTDWDSCVDALKPARFVQPSFISDCISFTANLQTVRVVLPGTKVDSAFGGVVGTDSISVSASAHGILDFDASAVVLPFAIGPTGASGSQACIWAQATANLDIDPCVASVQGNFGKLSIYLYGNKSYRTPMFCSGENILRMATNLVTGADHLLEPVWVTPGRVNDKINCPVMPNPSDQVEVWTGNAAGAIETGLFEGIATPTLEGRLLCKGELSSSDPALEAYPQGSYESLECVEVNSQYAEDIDHTPLWEYLNAQGAAETHSGDCAPGGGQVRNRAEMVDCLDAWKAYPFEHEDPLFTPELANSPRFAALPLLHADPGTGFSNYDIVGFLPVYIETVYFRCNALTCTMVHSPGEDPLAACPPALTPDISSCGWPANGQQIIEALTVFILSPEMLPDLIADRFPYRDGALGFNLER